MLQQMKSLILPEDESWKYQVRQIPQHSPDIAKLEQFETQLLFVPDHFQTYHKQWGLLEKDVVRFGGHAFTKGTYSMWVKSLGEESYPVVLREQAYPHDWRRPKPGSPAQLYGELFLVNTPLFYRENGLDKARLNTVQFQRKRIKLEIVYFKDIERPWFKESSKWHEGSLSRAEKALGNIEEAERLQIGPLVWSVTAWMYEGVPDYWNPQVYAEWPDDPEAFLVEQFKPARMFKTKEGLYYYSYTRDDTT